MYILNSTNVVKVDDGSIIPFDTNNLDYQQYLDWVQAGNTPQDSSLTDIQETKISEIESAYRAEVTSDIVYLGSTFQADVPTEDNIKSVLSCGVVPDGFAWFDINNIPVPMTYLQLQGLSQALVFRGFASFAKKQGLKARIRSATNSNDVAAIVW